MISDCNKRSKCRTQQAHHGLSPVHGWACHAVQQGARLPARARDGRQRQRNPVDAQSACSSPINADEMPRLQVEAEHQLMRRSWFLPWCIASPTFLRQTFVEWAGSTIPRSYWAGAYYRQQRNKGCSDRVAVRALAFEWIRILYRRWKTHTPYDESVYLTALRRRGSPLLAYDPKSSNNT